MDVSATRERNRILNLREYAEGATLLRSRPRYVLVELTRGCNLSCPMCRPEIIATKGATMSRECFERVADELFPMAEMVDLRGWGESLILPDVEAFVRGTAQFGPAIRFVTNLSFARDDIIDLLAEFSCHIGVSVDTADPDLFARLRRGATLAGVERNLGRLATSYRQRGTSADLLHLICTVQRPALERLADVVELSARCRIPEVRFHEVTVSPDSELSLAADPEAVDRALSIAAQRARALGVRLFAGTRLGTLAEKTPGAPACLHPWTYATVSFDGRVGFCDHLIGEEGDAYYLGDLASNSFEEIWNGVEWQDLRREHRATRRASANKFHECAWCYKNRYVDFEHLFDPSAEPKRVRLTRRWRDTKTRIGQL